jgi:hypothetical protein
LLSKMRGLLDFAYEEMKLMCAHFQIIIYLLLYNMYKLKHFHSFINSFIELPNNHNYNLLMTILTNTWPKIENMSSESKKKCASELLQS